MPERNRSLIEVPRATAIKLIRISQSLKSETQPQRS